MKILIVEDELNLALTLKDYLENYHYKCHHASSFFEAQDYLHKESFDLALVDIELPDGSGFQLAKNITIPFFFITAQNHPSSRLQGLELGAKDYITKPFHLKELLLRIEKNFKKNKIYDFKTFKFFPEEFKIITFENKTFFLSKKESQLLAQLYEHQPNILSREDIMNKIFHHESSARTIDNFIVKFRKNFFAQSPYKIVTIHGIGYKLERDFQ